MLPFAAPTGRRLTAVSLCPLAGRDGPYHVCAAPAVIADI
jgi:hypothetical protein